MGVDVDRRRFVQLSATAGLAFWTGIRRADGDPVPEQKLNVGCIGCGGRGWGDVEGVSSQNVIALCDVDDRQMGNAVGRFPNARRFKDFRKMLEEVPEIEAVTVATPDHTHAAATVMAMRMGKHVYTEKPLVRTVHEARTVRRLALENPKLATQMGNQGTANGQLRTSVEVVRSGALGTVTEAHVWTNRPVWPQGIDRPAKPENVPEGLDWDLWLGPAPVRPYRHEYLPFAWRGWFDYGTGALGDMACHTLNMPFMALELGYPSSVDVWAQSTQHAESFPSWSILTYEFPARGDKPPVRLTWYDGGRTPPEELFMGEPVIDSGSLLIGDKGTLYSPHDYGDARILLPRKQFEGFQNPPKTLPRSPSHHQEWINACKGGPPAMSNFGYAAFLTEVVVLGCVALRLNRRISWDAKRMRVPACPDADVLIRPPYRQGWTL
ncbi:MAG: Gfo/Idh/MocA family oxidoreductase [Armatimonadetes bacterium]|nr:Gfo/Idh/MocA family oxidoreductase [Armatimonadota bacterium]